VVLCDQGQSWCLVIRIGGDSRAAGGGAARRNARLLVPLVTQRLLRDVGEEALLPDASDRSSVFDGSCEAERRLAGREAELRDQGQAWCFVSAARMPRSSL
jgi:hypothetical protein